MSADRLAVVVGCEGFIGRNLLEKLSTDSQNHILGIDKTINKTYSQKNISLLKLDVLESGSRKEIRDFLSSQSDREIFIVHLAGLSDILECEKNETLIYDLNLKSLENVCGFFSGYNVKRILFSSSALVYGTKYQEAVSEEFPLKPETVYARSKIEAENYLTGKFFEQAAILRLANVYGKGGSKKTLPATVLEQLKNGFLELREYTSVRDFLYIKDAVDAFNSALLGNLKFKIYNVGTSRGYSVYDFCAVAAKVLQKEHLLPKKVDSRMNSKLVLSCSRIEKDINWYPAYSLERGLTEIVRENG